MNLEKYFRKLFFYNRCGICNNILADSSIYICNHCKEKIENKKNLTKIENIYYLFKYDQDIKNLIKNYKFSNRKYIGFFISNLIKEDINNIITINNIQLIIPVPLNKTKENFRGFNQVSFLLDLLDIRYKTAIRERNTLSMSSLLDKSMRQMNISSAFSIPFDVTGKNILIVDDIITTGSTIKELIREIYKSGKPSNIYIFSFSAASYFLRHNF